MSEFDGQRGHRGNSNGKHRIPASDEDMSDDPITEVIALPEDMLTSLTDVPPLSGPFEMAEPAPAIDALTGLQAILEAAERPLVITGGCNWTAEGRAHLQAFAETSDIPVVAAFRYQDQFDNHSDCYAGEAGVGMPPHVKDLIARADVVLAVNIRFGEMTTDAYTLFDVPEPRQTVIHVHPDASEIGKIYAPRLGLQAGPNAFAASLTPVRGDWADWRAEARAAYEASLELPDLPSPVDMGKVTAHLRAVLPEDAIITNGAGNFAVWPNKFVKYGKKSKLLAVPTTLLFALQRGHSECLNCWLLLPTRVLMSQGLFHAQHRRLAVVLVCVPCKIYCTLHSVLSAQICH